MTTLTLRRQERARLRAADRAFASFAAEHPDWVEALFDRHFLDHRAAPLLRGGPTPDLAAALGRAWADQWGGRAADRARRAATVRTAAERFATLFASELEGRPARRIGAVAAA